MAALYSATGFPREFNAAADLIERNIAAGRAAKTAIHDDQGSYTYAALAERVNRFANAIRSCGVGMESRILVCLRDSIDFPTVFLGAIKAGVVPVAVNTLLTATDYDFMLRDSRAQALVVSAALLPALLRTVLRSPFGRALVGIKANEQRMRSLGYPVFRYKLGAFVFAGMLAGLAGYLAACQFGFINPEILSWHHSGNVLMMLLLGGMGRLYGAVAGAFALVLMQELFSSQALFGAYAKHWQLAMGSFIVLVVLLLPRGLAGLIEHLGPKQKAKPADDVS